VSLISLHHVGRETIGVRKDCDRANSQFPTCADDPHGNLTAIGYEDCVEQGWLPGQKEWREAY